MTRPLIKAGVTLAPPPGGKWRKVLARFGAQQPVPRDVARLKSGRASRVKGGKP